MSIATLTTAQITVLEALASGQTLSSAAKSAAVSRQTIYTWLKSNPAFQSALDESKHQYSAFLRERLQLLANKALDRLEAILDNPVASPSVQLRASLAVLAQPEWNFPNPFGDLPAPDLTKLDTNSAVNPVQPEIPRKAPCPCGSGEKFKRCCGKDAPPVLHSTARAA